MVTETHHFWGTSVRFIGKIHMLQGDPKLDVRERSVFLFDGFRDQLEISEEPQSGSSEISIFRGPLISDGYPVQQPKIFWGQKTFGDSCPYKFPSKSPKIFCQMIFRGFCPEDFLRNPKTSFQVKTFKGILPLEFSVKDPKFCTPRFCTISRIQGSQDRPS